MLTGESLGEKRVAITPQAARKLFNAPFPGNIRELRATLRSAQMQEGLSNEIAFQAAGADAVNRALKGNMTLLEPVMRTEVTIPEEYLGPVSADMNARRAEIREVFTRGKLRVIEALVPLAKMFDYSDKVRSLTQGRASWTMEPSAYAPVDPDTLRQMMNPDGF